MAAALQKEMNDSITVVATTTLTTRGRCSVVIAKKALSWR